LHHYLISQIIFASPYSYLNEAYSFCRDLSSLLSLC